MVRRVPALFLLILLAGSLAAGATAEKGKKPQPSKDEYYELYKVLVDTMDQVERNYVKDVDRRELMEAAIKGVLSKLDPYSAFISPEEIDRFRTTVESEFGGIGIQIAIEGGQLKILSPLAGTPAYRAGLLAGDRIVEVDGKNTDGITLEEAVARLKGKEGTTVTLTVIHPGKSAKHKIAVTREKIHVETVLADHRKSDDSWDFMLDPKDHIGYVRLSAFSRDTAAELRKALEQLQSEKMRALIVDLRFNPGGLLNSAIEVSNLFVSKGRIVSTKGRNSPERVWDARKNGAFEGFPMVILVNRYSASASEIVAACLQDHKRAVIMGERTWGKGSVQNVIELEDGRSALKLTTASYRRPSGKNIHRFDDAKESDEWGVMPDKGFDMRLGDTEIVGLIEDRRQRDILRPGSPEAAEPGELGEKPAETKPADKPEQKQEKPEGKPEKPDAGQEKPGGDSSRLGNDSPEDNKKPPASKESAAPAVEYKAQPVEKPFIDRQLEMAVKYLTTELARAK